jgi:DNA-binding transcriptional ArsR family regulator
MEKEQIKELSKKGQLWDYIILDELGTLHAGDIKAREIIFLCSIGRLVQNRKPYSFNCLLLTKSSSGKDHLIRNVLKLFDKYDKDSNTGVWERYGRISETTLNYLHERIENKDNPEKSLNLNFNWSGKILYLPEITEKVLNNEVMKEFTSGEDSEEVSEVAITKRKSKGVDIIQVRGKPEVFCSTAKTIPSEEIRNRFNIVGLDLSEEQTESIFRFEEGEISEGIKIFLSEMKPREVKIPKKILNFIIKVFPKDKIRYRRDFSRFLDFIKAYALFNGRNIADEEDYNRAKDIFINAYSNVSDIPLRDIDEDIIKVLEKSKESLSANEIHKEIEKGEKYTIKTIYKHLEELEKKEIIKSEQERILTGYLVTKYSLTKEFINKKPFLLPNYDEDIIKGAIKE